ASSVRISSIAEIEAVGHRVTHGGERFMRSVRVDDEVIRGIEETIELAPLHNPNNLKGIQAARSALGPGIPQVAVFDTAFHHTLPDHVAAKEGLSAPEVEGMLNKQSGLLGVSGLTNDMRDLLAEEKEHDDRRARLAIDLFCYRARKYIGAYLAAMNGADAIVFAGGV